MKINDTLLTRQTVNGISVEPRLPQEYFATFTRNLALFLQLFNKKK
jgi:hypothetical protein